MTLMDWIAATFSLAASSRRGKPVFWQYGHPHANLKGGKPEHQSPTFAMRDGRWKFLVNPDGSEAQLFDLEADEGETTNLLSKQPERAAAMAAQISAWADDLGFAFDNEAPLTAPVPTIAILASNQLLRFVNHGVKGDTSIASDWMGNHGSTCQRFERRKWPEAAHSGSRAPFAPSSPSGVVLAHGGNRAGYSVYLNEGHLCFASVREQETYCEIRSSVGDNWFCQVSKQTGIPKARSVSQGEWQARRESGTLESFAKRARRLHSNWRRPNPTGRRTTNTPNHFSGIIENSHVQVSERNLTSLQVTFTPRMNTHPSTRKANRQKSRNAKT